MKKLSLLLLLVLIPTSVPVAQGQIVNTWVYTDGIETDAGFIIVNHEGTDHNYSLALFQENYWKLYDEAGYPVGLFQNISTADRQMTNLEYITAIGFNYLNPTFVTFDVNVKAEQTVISEDYSEIVDFKRIDSINFTGFGSYTFPDNQTVATVDLVYHENTTSRLGYSELMIGGQNNTYIWANGNGTHYINGVFQSTFELGGGRLYALQFSPSVSRVVNITRIEQGGLSVDGNENRQMLSYSIDNYVDWEPPAETSTTTTSTTPTVEPTTTIETPFIGFTIGMVAIILARRRLR